MMLQKFQSKAAILTEAKSVLDRSKGFRSSNRKKGQRAKASPAEAKKPCTDDNDKAIQMAAGEGLTIRGCADVAGYCEQEQDIQSTCCATCEAKKVCTDNNDKAIKMVAGEGFSISGCGDLAGYCDTEGDIQSTCCATCKAKYACTDDNAKAVEMARLWGGLSISGCEELAGYCATEEDIQSTCCATCTAKTPTTECTDDNAKAITMALLWAKLTISSCAELADYCGEEDIQSVCCATCAAKTLEPPDNHDWGWRWCRNVKRNCCVTDGDDKGAGPVCADGFSVWEYPEGYEGRLPYACRVEIQAVFGPCQSCFTCVPNEGW
jgi:hypothetical protein